MATTFNTRQVMAGEFKPAIYKEWNKNERKYEPMEHFRYKVVGDEFLSGRPNEMGGVNSYTKEMTIYTTTPLPFKRGDLVKLDGLEELGFDNSEFQVSHVDFDTKSPQGILNSIFPDDTSHLPRIVHLNKEVT